MLLVIAHTNRKRKLFAQQDLPQLIQQEGLGAPGHSLFKLDVFDDTDFESRLCSQWVPKTPGTRHGGWGGTG